MNIDELKYGNLTIEQVGQVKKESYLDTYFAEFTQVLPPLNSSQTTKSELNELVRCLDDITHDPTALKKFQRYDRSMHDMFIHYLIQKGIPETEATPFITNLTIDVMPLIVKLKEYYQRPRPVQLAYYYKLQLHPYKSYSSDSPAYPSSHAIQAKLFANVIGNKYPKLNLEVQKIAHDVIVSRLYMGANYASSLDYGVVIADRVVQNKELCVKFSI